MLKKLQLWLFPATVKGFEFDAVDRDGDGIIQEGTPFERKLAKSVAKASKAPVKKATAKKPAKKKAPAKKPATKKPVKKTTKKKK